ncbi:MAG TPA: hypothetical protein VJ863_03925 [Sphaerochaeta sp.]|nr:hypothetical protein [Sphaerochaeta sp.]
MKIHARAVVCLILTFVVFVSCEEAGVSSVPWPDPPSLGVTVTTDAEYMKFGLGLYHDIIGITETYHSEGFPSTTVGISHSYPDSQSYQYTFTDYDRGSHISDLAIPAGTAFYTGTLRSDHPSIDGHPAEDMTRYIEKLDFTVSLKEGLSTNTYVVKLVTKIYNAGPTVPVEITFTTFDIIGRQFTQAELKAMFSEITTLL